MDDKLVANVRNRRIADLASEAQNELMVETSDEVYRPVKELSAYRRIEPDSRLLHDLHLDGDDADELLERIATTFGTSFANMPFTDYFHDETEALAAHVAASLNSRSGKKPLTLHHLCDVVKSGEWFDPPAVR